ncbi:hypothetical protein HK100_012186 [Physocladia obscura]|uniref:Dilute domain-containing protein n=1 Tax=Physocladia obscura TaxID=109957 RepID=A0AAD5T304_9FUNG|nr:hypothetical protein HK100_012186 [Physocladia obscura]
MDHDDSNFKIGIADRLCNAKLIQAASNGDAQTLNEILTATSRRIQTQAELTLAINAKDSDGLNALLHASCWGHDRIVARLIDTGASLDVRDQKGWTPIMWACSNGHVQTARILRDSGARIDIKSFTGKSIYEIVKYAPNKGQIQSLLVNTPDAVSNTSNNVTFDGRISFSVSDYSEVTAFGDDDSSSGSDNSPSIPSLFLPDRLCKKTLIQAASNGDTDSVAEILSSVSIRSHSDLIQTINAKDADGLNALLHAACWGHDRIVALLIDFSANLNVLDPKGWTPIMWACSNGHVRTVAILHEAGARIDIKSFTGKSIWEVVKYAPNKDQILLLLGNNPDLGDVHSDVKATFFLMRSSGQFSVSDSDITSVGDEDDELMYEDFDWKTCKFDQMIVFEESNLNHILSVALSYLHPLDPHHPTILTANIVFLCARYAHYVNPSEVLDRFFEISILKMEYAAHLATETQDLASWIANFHHLLYYLKRDESLQSASYEYQARISDILVDAYERLVRKLENYITGILETGIINFVGSGFTTVHMESILGVFSGSGKRHNNIMRRTGGIISALGGARIVSVISTAQKRTSIPKSSSSPSPPQSASLSPGTFSRLNFFSLTPATPAAGSTNAIPKPPTPPPPSPTLLQSTPHYFIKSLKETRDVLTETHVHPSIISQIFLQLFRAINARIFNRILASTADLVSRSRAAQMLANLEDVVDWLQHGAEHEIPGNGGASTAISIPYAALVSALTPSLHLLWFIREVTSARELYEFLGLKARAGTLTVAQVRRVMCMYRFEVGEPSFSQDVEDFVVREWNEAVAMAAVAAAVGVAEDDDVEREIKRIKEMVEFYEESRVAELSIPMIMRGNGYVQGMAVQPVVPSEILAMLF